MLQDKNPKTKAKPLNTSRRWWRSHLEPHFRWAENNKTYKWAPTPWWQSVALKYNAYICILAYSPPRWHLPLRQNCSKCSSLVHSLGCEKHEAHQGVAPHHEWQKAKDKIPPTSWLQNTWQSCHCTETSGSILDEYLQVPNMIATKSHNFKIWRKKTIL